MLVSVVQHLVSVDQVFNIVVHQQVSIQDGVVHPMLVVIVVLMVVELVIAVHHTASMSFSLSQACFQRDV